MTNQELIELYNNYKDCEFIVFVKNDNYTMVRLTLKDIMKLIKLAGTINT